MEFFAVVDLDEDNIQTTRIYTKLEDAEKEYEEIDMNWTTSKAIIKVKEGESFGGSTTTMSDTWSGGGEVLKQEDKDREMGESVKPRIQMFEDFNPTNEGSGKYPELDALVMPIADATSEMINSKIEGVESKMPYKAQYVLEEVIAELEKRV